MRPGIRLLLFLGAAAALILCLVYFGVVYVRATRTPQRPKTHGLTVAGTIYPLYDIARNVVGGQAAAKLIVPPGVSPHFFEFSPRQLEALQDVKLIFRIGHGLDDWVRQVTSVSKAPECWT